MEDDTEALDNFATIAPQMVLISKDPEQPVAINSALGNYDFEQALSLVNTFMKEHGMTPTISEQ
ncbi:hypothetical protein [Parendozoicomonas sp. Alg238-R29]|uniref:hypothetical protein n=1 Tax=Parendozoicomonas sp. Alg238-R29 TaxID=2993446 RepID=UPI00248F0B67|nr:hypothetical protein [Parendozoicomonas sp. Alg238-R29]